MWVELNTFIYRCFHWYHVAVHLMNSIVITAQLLIGHVQLRHNFLDYLT